MVDFDPNKNYYDILGVSEEAGEDEIKKAFRKLAVKHHPDKWGDSEKFKEINEAYQVLSDKQKKQQYDAYRKWWMWWMGWMWGMWGWWFDMEDIFDMFWDFFWGWGWWMWWWGRRRTQKWENIISSVSLTFEEAFKGTSKDINYTRYIACDDCNGQWVASDSQRQACPDCSGRGVKQEVRQTPFGMMQVQTACTKCGGVWYINSKPCQKCGWNGLMKHEEEVSVNIPSGMNAWEYVKVPWMGNYGPNNWPAWDLLIKIHITWGEKFRRKWDDLLLDVEISIFDVVLWNTIEVEHPEWKMKVKIPKWLQVNDVVRVTWKWYEKKWWFMNKNWDFIVVPHIKIPKKLSKEEEDLWKQLRDKQK